MAAELSSEQRQEFTEAFSLFDKDGNQCISSKELGAVMRSLGLTPSDKDLIDLIGEVDADASGTIELPEFLRLMASHVNETDSEEEMRAVFRVFDKAGLGFITDVELRHVFANLGEKPSNEDLEDMIAAADTHGQGRVSYDDFVNIVTSK